MVPRNALPLLLCFFLLPHSGAVLAAPCETASYEGLIGRASAALQLGAYERAGQLAAEAHETCMDRYEALEIGAKAAFGLGRKRLALDLAAEALERVPTGQQPPRTRLLDLIRSWTREDTGFVDEKEIASFLEKDVVTTKGVYLEATGRTPPMPPGMVLDLPSIRFRFDSAGLESGAVSQLAVLGTVLSSPAFSGVKLVVEGHASPEGGAGYNCALSHRRAEAVRDYLINHFSIDPARLGTRWWGELPEAPESVTAASAAPERVVRILRQEVLGESLRGQARCEE